MKTNSAILLLCALALDPSTLFAATNDLSGQLQRGLFEEEANRNLDAAAQAYQTVSAQFDKDRKLAATAIFRLGEVYRKQNKTNEAVVQYERIVREFSDQDTLATLSRQNLAGLGASKAARSKSGDDLQLLRSQYAHKQFYLSHLKQLDREKLKQELPSLTPDNLLAELLSQLSLAQTALDKQKVNSGAAHPTVREQEAIIKSLERQIDERLAGLMAALELQARAQKAQLDELEKGGQPSSVDTTPVVQDAEETEIRRIQTMIQNSPDLINAPREGGFTPLGRAAIAGWLRVAKYLLDHGAAIQQGGNNSTPLHLAVTSGHRAMVEMLFQRGAALEARDGTGSTPLHIAAELGFLSVAEVLVQRKASLEAENSKANGNRTPLERAAGNGHVELVAFLAGKGAQFKGALSLAVVGGHTDALKKLLELRAKPDAEGASDSTALIYAVEKGNLEATKLLLAAKANPNLGKAKMPLVLAASGKNLEIAELLLRAGADPNRAGQLGSQLNPPRQSSYPHVGISSYTPLQAAVSRNDVPMVKLLLASKADPNTKAHEKSGWGGGPLTLWTFTNPEMLKAFLDAGADANAEVYTGRPLLSMAAQEAGTEAIEMLLAAGAKPDVLDNDGGFPLGRAAGRGCLPCVEALLKFKANPNLATEQSSTALLAAIRANSTNIVAALLAAGADPNQVTSSGWSPVHSAVWERNKEILTLLLTRKADPNVRASDGKTPLDLTKPGSVKGFGFAVQPSGAATLASLEELAALLRRHGAIEDLPDFKSISVSRKSSGYRATVFTKSTNDWNELSLNEVLLHQWGLLSTNLGGGWWRARAGMNDETWGPNPLSFPDLSRLVIYRPEVGGKSRSELEWNLVRIATERGKLQPIPLRFGDVVEVPEADHPVSQRWNGPDEAMLDLLIKSVTRTVTVTVGGKATPLTLSPTFARSTGSEYNRVCASFMLRSVLDESKLVRFSSDLTRVKVTRKAGPNNKAAVWLVDCTGKDQPLPDLWLRDGDVVDVPEKQ